MSKFVEGSYVTIEEAQRAIHNLISQGYSEHDITLVANQSVRETMTTDTDVNVTTDYDTSTTTTDTDAGTEDKSMWEKIKGAFTVDEYDETAQDAPDYNRDEDVLYAYKGDIATGNIVVLVDGEPDMNRVSPDVTDTTNPTVVPPITDPSPLHGVDATPIVEEDLTARDADLTDEEKITLQEERLDVDTHEVQTGEVNVKKNVTEEVKTVEVPVKHEEITVEKRPVADKEGTGETLGMEEEISIPITEEQIEVKKRPVVTDEVVINKETKEETKEVKDTVRKEDIDVDADGDVSVNKDDDLNRPL